MPHDYEDSEPPNETARAVQARMAELGQSIRGLAATAGVGVSTVERARKGQELNAKSVAAMDRALQWRAGAGLDNLRAGRAPESVAPGDDPQRDQLVTIFRAAVKGLGPEEAAALLRQIVNESPEVLDNSQADDG